MRCQDCSKSDCRRVKVPIKPLDGTPNKAEDWISIQECQATPAQLEWDFQRMHLTAAGDMRRLEWANQRLLSHNRRKDEEIEELRSRLGA